MAQTKPQGSLSTNQNSQRGEGSGLAMLRWTSSKRRKASVANSLSLSGLGGGPRRRRTCWHSPLSPWLWPWWLIGVAWVLLSGWLCVARQFRGPEFEVLESSEKRSFEFEGAVPLSRPAVPSRCPAVSRAALLDHVTSLDTR